MTFLSLHFLQVLAASDADAEEEGGGGPAPSRPQVRLCVTSPGPYVHSCTV